MQMENVLKNLSCAMEEMIAGTILREVAAPLSFIARIFPETKLFLFIGDDMLVILTTFQYNYF